ncbi:MAG: alanine racemase [Schleiferiaceae bacterium]|nr:alanine racemase [Schleiferiaceae bacterium]
MLLKAIDIALSAGATLHGNAAQNFEAFAFDSRRIHAAISSCFIALKTPHADGHHYIEEAISRGATTIICNDAAQRAEAHPELAFIAHPNPLVVVQSWAKNKRNELRGPLLAITGSTGKTVVKEWLFQLLGTPLEVHRTPGSFNSTLGIALAMSSLKESHAKAIIEVGIDRPGTMEAHAQWLQPALGIFTNLGNAHSEHFSNEDAHFTEKWLLFSQCERIATHRKWWDKAQSLGLPTPPALLWGPSEELDPDVLNEVAFTGGYELENAMNALAGAVLLGVPLPEALARLKTVEPLPMRLQEIEAKDGGKLIEDTYSSDLDSLRLALEQLMMQQGASKKWAVLSTLATPKLTAVAQAMVDKMELDRIWWVKDRAEVRDLVTAFEGLSLRDTTVLIKGQRRFKLEQLAITLRRQHHSTWAEINLGAMRRNLQKFQAKLQPNTLVMAMVKASGYGTGSFEIARALEEMHIDYLGVAFAQEALSLRAQGIQCPILVLNSEAAQLPMLAQSGCEVELFDMHQLKDWLAAPQQEHLLQVHIKVDTGMQRLGFQTSALQELLGVLQSRKDIVVNGIMTHLSASNNSEEDAFTKAQLAQFQSACDEIRRHYPSAKAHALNSYGIARHTQAQHDMVRLGLGLYGLGTYDGIDRLEEVLAWKCTVSQVGVLQPGETLGYSRAFKATEITHYATLPVGYADGLQRSLSLGKGAVYIRGKRCAILGSVCMDMVMVELGDLQIGPGEEAVLIGPEQSAETMAKDAGTISYEILTGLGARIPRLYLQD